MSGGIALEFRMRHPAMHQMYVEQCAAGIFRLGTFLPWQAPGVVIYNLATQQRPGPHADLDAIATSVRAALTDLEARGLSSIGLPRIGAGIGGLSWCDVSQTLHAVADASSVEVVVVRLA